MPQKFKRLRQVLGALVLLLAMAAAPLELRADCSPRDSEELVGIIFCHPHPMCAPTTSAMEGKIYKNTVTGRYRVCFECCTLEFA